MQCGNDVDCMKTLMAVHACAYVVHLLYDKSELNGRQDFMEVATVHLSDLKS